jgi:hypothetical protein
VSTNVLPENWGGSTYLSNSIISYDTLAQRVLAELGHPYIDVDVTDAQIAMFIDNSISYFSRYVTHPGEDEYFLFFDDDIDRNCGIRLDAAIHSCELSAGCSQSYWTNAVTSVSSNETVLYNGPSLLSAHTMGFNPDNTGVPINEQQTVVPLTAYGHLIFDKDNPWPVDVCQATHVSISALSAYPDTVIKSPVLEGQVSISDREGSILPTGWGSKDACDPLSAWWGVPSASANSFDPISATHIHFMNVPNCWIAEYSPISFSNGRGIKFPVCSSAIDTNGDISMNFQFVNYYGLPNEVSGVHELDENGGLRMSWNSTPECYTDTPTTVQVNTEFKKVVTVENMGLSAVSVPKVTETQRPRKVQGVFSVARDNRYTGYTGSVLFNFEYSMMANTVGNMSGWSNNGSSMSLVTYDLLNQFLELTGKLFMNDRVSYSFDPSTQILKVIKPRNTYFNNRSNMGYVIGVTRERKIEDYLKEPWIKDHVKAQVKIAAGNAIGKFQGVQLPGGATVNGGDILSQGLTEKKELEDYLKTTLDYGTGHAIIFA